MNSNGWSRREALGALVAGTLGALAPAVVRGGVPDLLFRDVLLVDGTGAAGRRTDVLVRGERIERIGRLSPRAARGARIVEGGGRVLAPGFIDTHAHGDPLEHSYAGFLAMGATTVLLGQDGGSAGLADASGGRDGLRAWLDAVAHADIDINVATLSGHGTLRRRAGIPDETRVPAQAQLARMQALLDDDLGAGAFGLSTGLEYVPGIYAETRELTALGGVVARHDGVAMSHMRSEDDDRVRASIEELIAASLPARPHISHLKVMYARGEAEAESLLAFLHGKREAGIELSADAYPYTAGYTGIAILFPEWALPPSDYAAVLAQRRDELRAHLQARMTRRGGPGALLLGTGAHAGRTLEQAAEAAGKPYPDLLIELGPGGASGAHFTMDEALQSRLLLDPIVGLCTDGRPGMRHPRATGTYAKWIAQYVVAERRLTLEEAVRKCTGLPASVLRIADRGVIRAGARADLLLFDPASVRARSDYADPLAHAEGFDMVVLNGRPAWEDGERVGRAGRLLRRGR
ncbi:amidohydrolase family protein [Luteimonas sp. SJ-92]|uniref:Amidohydrolase family protein n=1 Tax=Luteimonas salinisoli TaxID=2752307 RepID=A0A853JAM4_9GAMM|nr:amidohydrolase family protein [Luteimonas salinisoli]NZA25708.1 amidohydrolase family protein [Luteimonas salinisoli]